MTADVISELVAAALRLDSDDHDEYWQVVSHLEKISMGSLFPVAHALLQGDIGERELGSILLGGPNDGERSGRPVAEERIAALLGLLERESEVKVLRALANALGRFDDPRILPALWKLSNVDNWRVRWEVTMAASDREDDEADRLLVTLSSDTDERVRDWATAELGRLGKRDSVLIRDALAARLDDDDPTTAEEAMCGLAERADTRALDYSLRARASDEEKADEWEVLRASWNMAASTGDERLHGYLIHDHREFAAAKDYPDELRLACERCFGVWPPPSTAEPS